MSKARLLILVSLALSGCAGPENGFGPVGWQWPFAPAGAQRGGAAGAPGAAGGYAQFSFDWQLSGDPEIMPVQVFDDGGGMWLQFPPNGAWPAVFDVGADGWRPLAYRGEPPYMVLDGVFEHLELRGGHLRGSIRRAGHPMGGMPTVERVGLEPSFPGQHETRPAVASEAPAQAGAAVPALDSSTVPGTAVITDDSAASAMGETRPELKGMPADTAQRSAVEYLGTPIGRYAVSPADHTMRQALERWAMRAGWVFSAEHWAVDVDIPLVGEASFESDFKSAVRELLAATEMGDRPLQPCFYSNRVLRVVPYAQACDRRGGTRVVS